MHEDHDNVENIVHGEAGTVPQVVDTVADAEATPEVVRKLADTKAEDSRPSVLIPILNVLVEASTAFTPLQSAAGGLLKVVQVFEVRLIPLWYRSILPSFIVPAWGQKTGANKRDVAALEKSLKSLITMLQGPLDNPDRCPPTLRQRINRLFRSHFVIASMSSPVVSNTTQNDSSIDKINGALERVKQQRTFTRALRADDDEANITTCVQTLKQDIDNFLVDNPLLLVTSPY